MQLDSEQFERVLRVWPVARLATLAADGRPELVPMVFVALDGVLYSPVDGKPKRHTGLQRLRNIERDPRVALLLDHYGEDWQALWWLRVDAIATLLRAGTLPTELQKRVAGALRAKYPQYAAIEVYSGAPTLLCFTPTAHLAWSASAHVWADLVTQRAAD